MTGCVYQSEDSAETFQGSEKPRYVVKPYDRFKEPQVVLHKFNASQAMELRQEKLEREAEARLGRD